MATLIEQDRADVWTQIMRLLSADRDSTGLSKADLRAAIDAADAWAEANKAEYNAALPLPARTTLTAAQKARLLALVILKRYEKGA